VSSDAPWLTDGLDYPMFIVTAADGDRCDGCLVGFTTQCSIEPLRYLICLSRLNHTTEVARAVSHLGVHLVTEGTRDLAELFGTKCGAEVDKFSQCEWSPGRGGAPLLTRCPDRFVGEVLHRHDMGDHIGFVLQVTDLSPGTPESPITFEHLRDLHPGHPE
jgi:flavin reductase (DIM6/NTAB) family NADH-FMN oxidoreductase RutF